MWSVFPSAFGVAPGAATYAHPRLYFNAAEQEKLRGRRNGGSSSIIWKNIAESADWCVAKEHRARWVGVIHPDPKSENLYDRFYALAGDLAITEHLSFAYALSGDETYGTNARLWVLGLCHEWMREADGPTESGKAYNIARLLRTIAVGYDLTYDRLSRGERQEIRDLVQKVTTQYFADWYQTEAATKPEFHGHYAVVEWGSLGVVALTFLGEIPEAQDWLKATITKFEDHLLPLGLEKDGAALEGGSYWASTMQYRIFFMAALRHVTEKDLFLKYGDFMNCDLALAGIACEKNPGLDQNSSSVVLQPSFAQLNYYAPVMVYLAQEYGRAVCQQVGWWDHSMGQLEKTHYVTANGYQMLFALGGYAYVWNNPSLRARGNEARLSFLFPSVDEAYVRSSWQSGDIVAGVGKGELVVNAGGQVVLMEQGLHPEPAKGNHVQKIDDDGTLAKLESGEETNRLTLELNRPERTLRISRRVASEWQWSCQGKPTRDKNEIQWDARTKLRVVEGEITQYNPEGYTPIITVASGKIKLADPEPVKYPLVTVKPGTNGVATVEVQMFGRR